MMKRPLLFCTALVLLAAVLLSGSQVAGYLDLMVYPTAPGSPPSGSYYRVYMTSTGLKCKTNTGASCLASTSGSVTTPVTSTDVATPLTLPAVGSTTWYTKAGKLCNLDSSGTEWCMGGVQVPLVLTPAGTTSYANPGGMGDRSGLITVTGSLGWCFNGLDSWFEGGIPGCNSLINNGTSYNTGQWSPTISEDTGYVRFDFHQSFLIQEFKLAAPQPSNALQIKWQGSVDGSTYVDLTAAHSWVTSPDGSLNVWSAATNTTAYRYYRFLAAVPGMPTPSVSAFWQVYFKISGPLYSNVTLLNFGKEQNMGSVDDSAAVHTLPVQVGAAAALPATCTAGELYFASDAVAGQNLRFCTSTNTWTAPSSSSGTVATGAIALATSPIAAGACQAVASGSVNSAAAMGVLTTDVVTASPNGSLAALVGYVPSTSGGLTVAPYATSGYVNFDVCNWTAASITPGAVTLNWRVSR